ncbi:MAG TPA: DUF3179 domain-containing protein [Thermoanaerobaculia bacterium]|nr:DUF3179 domain-containing protein [Thermoanaerobaculia bacterium]
MAVAAPILGLLGVGAALPAVESLEPEAGYALIRDLMGEPRKPRRAAAERLMGARDSRFVPPLVDAYFFTSNLARSSVLEVLAALAGEQPGKRYLDWVEHVGARQYELPAGYAEWKASLLARIDTRYQHILYPGVPIRIRLDEVVWGGVRLDGIPALEHPPQVSAAEARHLRDGDRVFGVSLGGEVRAYPVKALSWHEMLNDTIGGHPVTLSYCTLCGSGILYSTGTDDGGAYTFGTSGLLYRSNKLMYDRQSYSLWANLTGEAVIGRKALRSDRLEILPMVLTTWRAWRQRHPETTVMAIDPSEGRRHGFVYQEGAADAARAGVAFPVWQKSDALDRNAEVYTLLLDGKPKAYPTDRLAEAGVVNDTLGERALVLVADPESGAIRAYERGAHRFSAGPRPNQLLDEQGRRYRVAEEALIADGLDPLPRLGGHTAFWFGWFGFYPHTELWTP